MTIIKRADFEKLKKLPIKDLLYNLYADNDVQLIGGLDHIVYQKKQIKIYDIGCNGKDNSCLLRMG